MASEGTTGLLRALASEHRLAILCRLEHGERSAGDLVQTIEPSQSALSQHLAHLRNPGIVSIRREGVAIFHQVADQDALALATALSAVVVKRRETD